MSVLHIHDLWGGSESEWFNCFIIYIISRATGDLFCISAVLTAVFLPHWVVKCWKLHHAELLDTKLAYSGLLT